jgi:hypothetical protein
MGLSKSVWKHGLSIDPSGQNSIFQCNDASAQRLSWKTGLRGSKNLFFDKFVKKRPIAGAVTLLRIDFLSKGLQVPRRNASVGFLFSIREDWSMRFLKCFLALAVSVTSSMTASAATIPSFKVAGSTSDTVGVLVDQNDYPTITISFNPATLTVNNLIDAGNSGLIISNTLAFAGGGVSFDFNTWGLDPYQDLPFVNPNLVTFTTGEGSFAYNSEKVNILPNYDPSVGHFLPGLTISDGQIVAYSRGTITGPGGSAPANFMLFVNLFLDSDGDGTDDLTPFGNVAWALYSPEVIPYPNAVPEPTSMAIFGLGALGFAYRARRRIGA